MWPGSTFEYDGTTCTFSQIYNGTIPWNDRVDTVMTWFKHKKTPINLAMMYIEDPDTHAHTYSPDSNVVSSRSFCLGQVHVLNVAMFVTQSVIFRTFSLLFLSLQTTRFVSKLDDLTKYIQQKLVVNKLDQRVNVIHLSDHGMSTIIPANFINLTDFVRNETISFYGTSPVLQVVPKDNSAFSLRIPLHFAIRCTNCLLSSSA